MAGSDDVEKIIIRNKLLGRWVAGKLGLHGREAESYSDSLAGRAIQPDGGDVFSIIRREFEAANVAETDEHILHMISESTIKAGNLIPSRSGNTLDAAAVALARNLKSP